jgi:hypothetical protein
MTTPYTYCLTHKQTKKHYYGSRTAVDCNPEELGVRYFSSSDTILGIIDKEGPECFSYRVMRTFATGIVLRKAIT